MYNLQNISSKKIDILQTGVMSCGHDTHDRYRQMLISDTTRLDPHLEGPKESLLATRLLWKSRVTQLRCKLHYSSFIIDSTCDLPRVSMIGSDKTGVHICHLHCQIIDNTVVIIHELRQEYRCSTQGILII